MVTGVQKIFACRLEPPWSRHGPTGPYSKLLNPLPPGFPKPVAPAVVHEPSIGRKVQTAVLADPTLSRSAKLTFRATSSKNKVILRGVVWDEKEKAYLGAKAAEIVGADNVDNRLTALNVHDL